MVYLDSGATTKVDPEVIKAMMPYFTEKYGNASSTHQKGQEAKRTLNDARQIIAKSIGAKDEEIIFTSGGTEANNFVLKGIAFANKDKGNRANHGFALPREQGSLGHIITTKIEHDCVLNSCKWLETQGFKVTYLDVDESGFVKPEDLENAITPETLLVSIIHGNNEIGTIQNLKELSAVCKKYNVYFHTDACQSYTKTKLNVKKQNLDLVTLNSHKIHGPRGVGALYIRKGTNITPLLHGGGQEFGLRSGTDNVAGVVGFAKAVQLANQKHVEYMTRLRDKLIEGVLKIPDTRLNGPTNDKRLCNNVNVSFKYVEGEAIGGYLDAEEINTSTGSACSSPKLEPSHVLLAIGLKPEQAHGSLRLTISRFTTEQEINRVLDVLPKVIAKLRKMSPLVKFIKKI
ncbi:aminotransferase class V-fold PLP-dependent enzyme [Candidatus Woesearchaeota archaeon]|nr:aminotransferase class V-fold PLP-dependent enzyme [Candidatus Woesearchaeota archaeon]